MFVLVSVCVVVVILLCVVVDIDDVLYVLFVVVCWNVLLVVVCGFGRKWCGWIIMMVDGVWIDMRFMKGGSGGRKMGGVGVVCC